MTRNLGLTAAALLLLTAGCGKQDSASAPAGNSAAPVVATAGQDWTETVTATPEGGFRMGNPDAPVKLVEYASLTCPHCAEFSKNAGEPLRQEVRSGRVSWEFRNFVLNPIDMAASLLTRCQGPGPFFKLVEETYAEQANWVAAFQTMPEAEQRRISALPEQQQFGALAKAGKLDQFFGSRGLPAAKAEACLADKAGLDALLAIREHGTEKDGVTGTPSFLINGAPQAGVTDWATLSPKLRSAGG